MRSISVLQGTLALVLLAGCAAADNSRAPLDLGTPPPGPPLTVTHRLTETCAHPHAALVACSALASVASTTVEIGPETDSAPVAVLSVVAGHPTYAATLSFPANYTDTVLGNLEVALLPYNDWRRLTPRPRTTRAIDPLAVDYEGVKEGVRGIRMRVHLTFKAATGRIGDTTMRVTMRGPAI